MPSRGNLTESELRDFFAGFKRIAYESLKKIPSRYANYAQIETSGSHSEIYPDFDATGAARIWLENEGRQYNSYNESAMRVRNDRVEYTIKVFVDRLNDGRFVEAKTLAIKLGQGMETIKNWMFFNNFNRGHLTGTPTAEAMYMSDGKPLFAADHLVLGDTNTGSKIYRSNYIPDTKPAWYLVTTTDLALKPGILQMRDPLAYAEFTKSTDLPVFNNNEYVFGMTERYGTHGMSWQCIARSEEELTPANIEKLLNLVVGTENKFGVAMMNMPNILMVPPTLLTAAHHALETDYIYENGLMVGENLKYLRNLLTIDVVPYLSNTKLTA